MALTRNDRLMKLVKHTLPDVTIGEWGPKGSPYTISTTEGGGRKLVIENRETGDRFGAVGKDLEDCISQLEARLLPKGAQ